MLKPERLYQVPRWSIGLSGRHYCAARELEKEFSRHHVV